MVTGALKPSGQASCGVCRMKLFQFQIFHLSIVEGHWTQSQRGGQKTKDTGGCEEKNHNLFNAL